MATSSRGGIRQSWAWPPETERAHSSNRSNPSATRGCGSMMRPVLMTMNHTWHGRAAATSEGRKRNKSQSQSTTFACNFRKGSRELPYLAGRSGGDAHRTTASPQHLVCVVAER